ncbi:MAG: GGDEF domain-containing protein [Spirochaetia bacterium]|nr:GGDEF domain-containing protein [Spirochaetia bacterium]
MFTLNIPKTPERLQVASQLLKILALFGIAVTIIDYINQNYIVAASALVICIISLGGLFLGLLPRYKMLPLYIGTWLMILMYLLGSFTQMPFHLDKAVWIIVFPFAFFYMTGLRVGLLISSISLLLIPINYWLFPFYSQVERISRYSLTQIIMAFALSMILAFKYEQIRSKQEALLKNSSESDPLTGMLNRRGFAVASVPVLQQAERSQQAFAVAMIDLDNFKMVNDIQGHSAGDKLLQEISSLLRLHTRSADIIARWGGEEFVLLLVHSDLNGASFVSEKIRSKIESHSFSCGKITASIGVSLRQPHETLEDTLKRADLAMYEAKQTGKNRVVFDSNVKPV